VNSRDTGEGLDRMNRLASTSRSRWIGLRISPSRVKRERHFGQYGSIVSVVSGSAVPGVDELYGSGCRRMRGTDTAGRLQESATLGRSTPDTVSLSRGACSAPMDSRRPLGFWASVGVRYEAEHAGPVGGWRASMPGERIVGFGRTKPLALADLKSAHAWATSLKRDRRSPQRTSPADATPQSSHRAPV
jgi:hypothetical protein